MSFLRHAEIYRSDVVYKTVESLGRAAASRWSAPGPAEGRSPRTAPCSSSAMSFRAGYSLAGCSPAEPASASPTALSIHRGLSAGNDLSANGNLSLVSVPQHRGAVHTVPNPTPPHRPTPTSWTVLPVPALHPASRSEDSSAPEQPVPRSLPALAAPKHAARACSFQSLPESLPPCSSAPPPVSR